MRDAFKSEAQAQSSMHTQRGRGGYMRCEWEEGIACGRPKKDADGTGPSEGSAPRHDGDTWSRQHIEESEGMVEGCCECLSALSDGVPASRHGDRDEMAQVDDQSTKAARVPSPKLSVVVLRQEQRVNVPPVPLTTDDAILVPGGHAASDAMMSWSKVVKGGLLSDTGDLGEREGWYQENQPNPGEQLKLERTVRFRIPGVNFSDSVRMSNFLELEAFHSIRKIFEGIQPRASPSQKNRQNG
ncbi:hypothetical protein C8R44DRAFT_946737 [Mycena epipterygia]|nr:hypothetical protein C8R44DRAFT_912955 [Mycena epipterygia]KAJ7100353.1 hypothetical protein C8R44DRAFT_946737 [Mycena epipterygia]